MPALTRTLSDEDAHRLAGESAFSPTVNDHAGVELEWLAISLEDPQTKPSHEQIREVVEGLGRLPGGGHITFEPGGQVELSTAPKRDTDSVIAAAETDGAALAAALHTAGVGLVGLGLDPARRASRVLDNPRYRAMEAYFATQGPAGAAMMQTTAALQVNVDVGRASDIESRWRIAQSITPVLAAIFVHSPLHHGAPGPWMSERLALWAAIDHTRARPVPRGPDCREEWTRYALDARVMLIRANEHDFDLPERPTTFAEWMRYGSSGLWPTADDLAYHLTTLFPPVRPRGWLEFRMFDALPDPWWRVAFAVVRTLLDDDDARARAATACAPLSGRWLDAARYGLRHPAFAAAANVCMAAALDALPRLGASAATTATVAMFHDRYTSRARTLADDRLDAWNASGTMWPTPECFAEPVWR